MFAMSLDLKISFVSTIAVTNI